MSDAPAPPPAEAAAPAPAPAAAESKPAHVFGSGTTFGTGTGFSGFTGVEVSKVFKPAEEGAAEEEADGENPDDEECKAEFTPLVQLEEVETTTGEEDEDALLELKSKLYRYDPDSNEWKERGVGQVKILQHKENKKVRLLMRQDKTLKIRANHIIMPSVKLQEHTGNDKAWVWSTVDFADETQSVDMFCIRFGSVERAQEFKKQFEAAQVINEKLIGTPAVLKDETAEEVDKLADEVEAKAEVSDKAEVAEKAEAAE